MPRYVTQLTPVERVDLVLQQRAVWRARLLDRMGLVPLLGGGHLQLTVGDVNLLMVVLRYQAVTLAQLQVALPRSEDVLRRRVKLLERAGLLKARPWTGGRRVFMATTLTHRWAGTGSRELQGGSNRMDHRLAIADHGIRWEREQDGDDLVVITEYEAAAHPHMPLHAVTPRHGNRPRTHLPDVIVRASSGRVWACEIELTLKSSRRLDEIMIDFESATRGPARVYDSIRYECSGAHVAEAVRAAAERVGIEIGRINEIST